MQKTTFIQFFANFTKNSAVLTETTSKKKKFICSWAFYVLSFINLCWFCKGPSPPVLTTHMIEIASIQTAKRDWNVKTYGQRNRRGAHKNRVGHQKICQQVKKDKNKKIKKNTGSVVSALPTHESNLYIHL